MAHSRTISLLPDPVILTFMLLVANLANTKWCKNPKKWLKPWHMPDMGIHMRLLQ